MSSLRLFFVPFPLETTTEVAMTVTAPSSDNQTLTQVSSISLSDQPAVPNTAPDVEEDDEDEDGEDAEVAGGGQSFLFLLSTPRWKTDCWLCTTEKKKSKTAQIQLDPLPKCR